MAWILQNQSNCCLQKTYQNIKGRHCLGIKGWTIVLQSNEMRARAGFVILISDTINLKEKLIRRVTEGYSIQNKGTLNQKDITILNIYAPNTGVPNFIFKSTTTFKSQININLLIVDNFSTLPSPINRSSEQNNQPTK